MLNRVRRIFIPAINTSGDDASRHQPSKQSEQPEKYETSGPRAAQHERDKSTSSIQTSQATSRTEEAAESYPHSQTTISNVTDAEYNIAETASRTPTAQPTVLGPNQSTGNLQPNHPHSSSADEDESQHNEPSTFDYLEPGSLGTQSPAQASHVVVQQKNATMRAFQKLRTGHDQLVRMRVNLAERRSALRQYQSSVKAVQSELVNFLIAAPERGFQELSIDLRQRFSLIPQKLTEQAQLEADCDELDQQILTAEFQISSIEEKFYGPGDSILADLAEIVQYRSLGNDGTESTVSTTYLREERSPKTNQYLSLTGDRDLVEERLIDLRSERAQLEADRTVRARVGLTLDEDSVQILSDFDRNHEELLDELRRIEQALENLQASDSLEDSFERGRQPTRNLDSLGQTQFYPGDTSFEIGAVESITLRQDAIPLLDDEREILGTLPEVPERPNLQAYSEAKSSDVYGKKVNTASLINIWLLNNLKHSSNEQRHLISFLRKEAPSLITPDLGQQIMDFWNEDETERYISERGPFSNHSVDPSARSTADNTKRSRAQSESALHGQKTKLPLLATGANTVAAALIARAIQQNRAQSPRSVGWNTRNK